MCLSGTVGEDEDVYCYCQRVAFGEMVACENAGCPREWVSFSLFLSLSFPLSSPRVLTRGRMVSS